MTVEAFLLWAEGREGKWELFDGVPVCMSPERVIHGDMKFRMAQLLDRAIKKARIDCHMVLDSALVRIDAHHGFQPDVLVYCGERVPGEALEVSNPLITVEILSPGNASYDLRDKLQGYFKLQSIAHYLIVDPDKKLVLHHRRGEDKDIVTRFITGGRMGLEPSGFQIDIAELFAGV